MPLPKTLKELLNLFSKWNLIKIDAHFYLGENVLHVDKDGKVLIDQKGQREVFLAEDKKGNIALEVNGTEIKRAIPNKKENIKALEKDKKVFTRADIAEP